MGEVCTQPFLVWINIKVLAIKPYDCGSIHIRLPIDLDNRMYSCPTIWVFVDGDFQPHPKFPCMLGWPRWVLTNLWVISFSYTLELWVYTQVLPEALSSYGYINIGYPRFHPQSTMPWVSICKWIHVVWVNIFVPSTKVFDSLGAFISIYPYVWVVIVTPTLISKLSGWQLITLSRNCMIAGSWKP